MTILFIILFAFLTTLSLGYTEHFKKFDRFNEGDTKSFIFKNSYYKNSENTKVKLINKTVLMLVLFPYQFYVLGLILSLIKFFANL